VTILSERDIEAAHPDAFDFVFGNLPAAKRAGFNRHLTVAAAIIIAALVVIPNLGGSRLNPAQATAAVPLHATTAARLMATELLPDGPRPIRPAQAGLSR
jgi:hypothetical protein